MAKFYVRSGEMKTVLDAENPIVAVGIAVMERVIEIQGNAKFGNKICISEVGFFDYPKEEITREDIEYHQDDIFLDTNKVLLSLNDFMQRKNGEGQEYPE